MLLLSSTLWSEAPTYEYLTYACIYAFLVWRVMGVVETQLNQPKNIWISSFASVIGKWFSGLHYILDASNLIDSPYRKAANVPYAVPTADRYLVLVRSKQQIEELTRIPEQHVSFHTAMNDRVFHKYTMGGFQYDKNDPHSTISVRALRIHLRPRISDLQPDMVRRIETYFHNNVFKNKSTDGWTTVRTLPMAKNLNGIVNAFVMVGPGLASNPKYIEAAMQYPNDAAYATEILRFTPTVLVPLLGPVIMRWTGAMQTLVDFIRPVIEERTDPSRAAEASKTNRDCLQWLIEVSQARGDGSVSAITQKALGFIFSFAHQPALSLTFAIHELCKHPEYVEPLRQEIAALSNGSDTDNYEDLPLLDSFLKESGRLNPLDSLVIQRRAVSPYTFADGTHVPAKNWIAVPQRPLMRDPAIYPNPETFNGSRFVTKEDGVFKSKSRFTHPSWSFPYWGSVKRACPARFYASRLLKLIMVHILTNYDLKLADEKAKENFSWNTAVVPRSTTAILIRKRVH